MEQNDIHYPQSVIKFGDSPNDILEGKNAKCLLSVGVLTGAGTNDTLKDADIILRSIMKINADVIQWIKRIEIVAYYHGRFVNPHLQIWRFHILSLKTSKLSNNSFF